MDHQARMKFANQRLVAVSSQFRVCADGKRTKRCRYAVNCWVPQIRMRFDIKQDREALIVSQPPKRPAAADDKTNRVVSNMNDSSINLLNERREFVNEERSRQYRQELMSEDRFYNGRDYEQRARVLSRHFGFTLWAARRATNTVHTS